MARSRPPALPIWQGRVADADVRIWLDRWDCSVHGTGSSPCPHVRQARRTDLVRSTDVFACREQITLMADRWKQGGR